jgi:hypothetical protein
MLDNGGPAAVTEKDLVADQNVSSTLLPCCHFLDEAFGGCETPACCHA